MSDVAGGPSPEGRSGGMSTGAKLLIGFVALVALGFVLVAVAIGVGGFMLKRGVESALGGFEEQQEASEVFQRLEDEYPFEVPADGVVTEDQLLRFLEVTDDAWEELGSWAAETAALGDRADSDEPGGLGDLVSGAKAFAGGARARVVLAESLEDAGMSLGEYAWTGLTMDRAAQAADRSADRTGVPGANLNLLERYGPRIPRLDENEAAGERSEAGDRGTVLAVAVMWGMTDLSTWQAMGLDTMGAAFKR